MYAIIEVAGKQYKVEKDTIVNVDKLKDQSGSIVIDKVLMFSNDGTTEVGQPYVSNVKVEAEILSEIQGPKVKGVKFKKRKNYTRTVGHRPIYSQLKINNLVVG